MPFHFPLATVLRYRESIEQRERLALEKIQQEIAGVELQIRQTNDARSVASENRIAGLSQGTSAAEMQAGYEYQKTLEQLSEILRARLQDSKKKWQQQLVTYEAARRTRETLDNLREKQHEVYNREQAKREQAAADDLFLSRRSGSN
jgi:flagellar export protein FliJ